MMPERDSKTGQSFIDETDKECALSNAELKQKCLIYARQYLQGKTFVNKDTGRKISISHQGLGEWKMKSKTREQILSIKILANMLENSIFDHDAPDKKNRINIERFSYFVQPCLINGRAFKAIITIKRTETYGDKYYHHYLENKK